MVKEKPETEDRDLVVGVAKYVSRTPSRPRSVLQGAEDQRLPSEKPSNDGHRPPLSVHQHGGFVPTKTTPVDARLTEQEFSLRIRRRRPGYDPGRYQI